MMEARCCPGARRPKIRIGRENRQETMVFPMKYGDFLQFFPLNQSRTQQNTDETYGIVFLATVFTHGLPSGELT